MEIVKKKTIDPPILPAVDGLVGLLHSGDGKVSILEKPVHEFNILFRKSELVLGVGSMFNDDIKNHRGSFYDAMEPIYRYISNMICRIASRGHTRFIQSLDRIWFLIGKKESEVLVEPVERNGKVWSDLLSPYLSKEMDQSGMCVLGIIIDYQVSEKGKVVLIDYMESADGKVDVSSLLIDKLINKMGGNVSVYPRSVDSQNAHFWRSYLATSVISLNDLFSEIEEAGIDTRMVKGYHRLFSKSNRDQSQDNTDTIESEPKLLHSIYSQIHQ